MANMAKCIPVKNVASEVMTLETLKKINRTINFFGQIKLHKDLEDNSNEDEDCTKSKEGEMLLQEDSEN